MLLALNALIQFFENLILFGPRGDRQSSRDAARSRERD